MTKEALKQEAEEKAKKRMKGFKCQENCEKSYIMGALDFAEPREKQIAKLEERNKNQEESLRITLLEEERKARRIKELEKENAEIKAKYLQATNEGTSWVHLKKLESENAKLKSLLEEKHKVGNNEFWKTVWHSIWRNEELEKENEDIKKALSVCNASNSFNKEQLTKAKDIIEKLISQNRKLWVYSDVREEAEQFLKEMSE